MIFTNIKLNLFMFKFKNNLFLSILENYFQYTNQIHAYCIRSANLLGPDLARNTIKTQGPTV